jgi:alpha-glucosidase (family GH31 glycosyl hydrolase)
MRSLAFAYPGDGSFNDMSDEYLYGSSILVAPVMAAKATSRNVYLPAGRWMNYNDKRTVYEGMKTVTVPAPLGTIPLFVREGAIISRGDIVRLNNNWDANWSPKLRIEIFPSRKEPTQFNYFTGSAVQKISVTPNDDALTIQFGALEADGVVEVYCRKAKQVARNGTRLREGADYRYDGQTQRLTVPFTDSAKVVIKGGGSLF